MKMMGNDLEEKWKEGRAMRWSTAPLFHTATMHFSLDTDIHHPIVQPHSPPLMSPPYNILESSAILPPPIHHSLAITMVPFGSRVVLGLVLFAVACQALPRPQADDDEIATPVGGSEDHDEDLQQLENELAQAAAANLAARAIKLEQRLEDEILSAAVATLKDPNPERRAARMAELGDMVKRDKRTVQAITGLLGASSSGSAGVAGAASRGATNVVTAGAGATTGVIGASVNAATGLAGAAGGAVVDVAQRGSSAGALVGSLVSSVLGSSSSAASGASGLSSPPAPVDGVVDPGAGGFSPLRLLSDSVSTVLRIKFSIFRSLFSLVSGVLSASSGSGGAPAA
ncbi:hypothetical protein B566_EDAN017302 [Ephemera danica]|nr:hypothetical protein B566_EDAN017302 [Ephemera danica]